MLGLDIGDSVVKSVVARFVMPVFGVLFFSQIFQPLRHIFDPLSLIICYFLNRLESLSVCPRGSSKSFRGFFV